MEKMIGFRKSINYFEHLLKVFALYGTILFVIIICIILSINQDTGVTHVSEPKADNAVITKYYTDKYNVFVFAGKYKPTIQSSPNIISDRVFTDNFNTFQPYSNNKQLNSTNNFAHPIISRFITQYNNYLYSDQRSIIIDSSITQNKPIEQLLNVFSPEFQYMIKTIRKYQDDQHSLKGLFWYFDDDYIASQPLYNIFSNLQNAISAILYYTQISPYDLPIYLLTSPKYYDTFNEISSTLIKSSALIYNNITDYQNAIIEISDQIKITDFYKPYFTADFSTNRILAGDNYDCSFNQEFENNQVLSTRSAIPLTNTTYQYGEFSAYQVTPTRSLAIQCELGNYNQPSGGTGGFDLLYGDYTVDIMLEQQYNNASNQTGGVLFRANGNYNDFVVAINPIGLSGIRLKYGGRPDVDFPWNTTLVNENIMPEGFTQLTFIQNQQYTTMYMNGVQLFYYLAEGFFDMQSPSFFHSDDSDINNWDNIAVKSLNIFSKSLNTDEIKYLRYANFFLNSPSLTVQSRPPNS